MLNIEILEKRFRNDKKIAHEAYSLKKWPPCQLQIMLALIDLGDRSETFLKKNNSLKICDLYSNPRLALTEQS